MECVGVWEWTNQGARVLAVKSGDVVGRHFADVDLEVQEPAWEERDIARVQNVDVWCPYFVSRNSIAKLDRYHII